MNKALSQVMRHISPEAIRQHPMFRDSVSVTALVVALGFNLLTLSLLLLKVHKVDYPVPVHYLSLVGFDQVGPWYTIYRMAAFGFLVTAINTLLAGKAFHRHRLTSFFLLVGAAAVGALCLVIASAFAVIV